MNDLKDYDNKIVYLVVFNIALFLLINYKFELILKNFDIVSIILSIPVIYLPIYLINNLIPRSYKFKLLYFNKSIPTFASDIFSKMKDNKINYDSKLIDLKLIFENHYIPQDNIEEDNFWYNLYLKHRYNPKVYQQNKDFMLCRDYVSLIIPFTILFSIIIYLMGIPLRNILIWIILSLIELIIFRRIAIKLNEKFALSVLQEETYYLKNND